MSACPFPFQLVNSVLRNSHHVDDTLTMSTYGAETSPSSLLLISICARQQATVARSAHQLGTTLWPRLTVNPSKSVAEQDLSGGTLAVGSRSEVLATTYTGAVRFTPAVSALKWAYQPMAVRDDVVAGKVTPPCPCAVSLPRCLSRCLAAGLAAVCHSGGRSVRAANDASKASFQNRG